MTSENVFKEIPWVEGHFYNAKESLPIPDTVCMKQVHFAHAVWLDEKPNEWVEGDALITRTPGLKLTVRTADCAPILIVETQARLIAAIHAGWKSAVQGIIENSVSLMIQHGGNPENMVAKIGPHLQIQSFIVSPEMKALFAPIHQHFFTEETDQIFFDFDGYIQMRLRHAQIENIQSDGTDTFTNLLYNSYRRAPNDPARQFSTIEIKEV